MTDFDIFFKETVMPEIFSHASDVNYHSSTGVVTAIKAFIDRNVEVFPGGFDSNVAERRTEISVQKSDASHIQRGELIATDDDAWIVQDIIFDDGIEIRVSAL